MGQHQDEAEVRLALALIAIDEHFVQLERRVRELRYGLIFTFGLVIGLLLVVLAGRL